MRAVYPVLAGEIAKRGIKKHEIAKRLNISYRALYSKLTGESEFTWPEAQTIQECFFPELDLKTLFSKEDTEGSA